MALDSETIEACANCGSLDIKPVYPTKGFSVYYCNRCKRRVLPLLFDSLEDYKNFLKEIKTDPGSLKFG